MLFELKISAELIRNYLEPYFSNNKSLLPLEDIYFLSKEMKLNSLFFNGLPIQVEVFDKCPNQFLEEKEEPFFDFDRKYIEFAVSTEIEEKTIDEALIKEGWTQEAFDENRVFPTNFVRNTLINLLKNAIDEIIIFSNISKPGAFNLSKGVTILNGQYCDEYLPLRCTIQEALEKLEDKLYPSISFVSAKEIFTKAREMNIGFKLEPKCSLEKGLNCISHMFNPNSEPNEKLMHGLIGLESIFVEGEQGIQKQMNEKIQLFFNKLETNKRIIKSMYNVRSKLFHGEISLVPFNYSRNGIIDGMHDTESDLYEVACHSQVMLVSTVQKMILSGRREVNFQLSLM